MPDRAERAPTPGRTLVRRRAIADVVRAAVLGSYGVTGLSAPSPMGRIRCRVRAGVPGIRVATGGDPAIDVYVTVAYGVPVAEVARQVDSAIRWSLRRALGVEVGRVSIHVDGMTGGPFATVGPAGAEDADAVAPGGPAGSGEGVAAGADER
ncbi:MAG: Asp23/Gls24 family envelope stress response protein [Chloroflexi bacterium]|jgi:uncharacterized alkaline shock family protein YloU|nr:Asp23/Gls24 family envelope stress response protein [Chloroflexota bacterium]